MLYSTVKLLFIWWNNIFDMLFVRSLQGDAAAWETFFSPLFYSFHANPQASQAILLGSALFVYTIVTCYQFCEIGFIPCKSDCVQLTTFTAQ